MPPTCRRTATTSPRWPRARPGRTSRPSSATSRTPGTCAIESLQIRYVSDPNASDDPQQFQMQPVGVCSTAVMPFLREIRLQVVARALISDRAASGSPNTLYSTPGFEGTTTSNPAFQDAFPRRTFTVNAVPRNLQAVRL